MTNSTQILKKIQAHYAATDKVLSVAREQEIKQGSAAYEKKIKLLDKTDVKGQHNALHETLQEYNLFEFKGYFEQFQRTFYPVNTAKDIEAMRVACRKDISGATNTEIESILLCGKDVLLVENILLKIRKGELQRASDMQQQIYRLTNEKELAIDDKIKLENIKMALQESRKRIKSVDQVLYERGESDRFHPHSIDVKQRYDVEIDSVVYDLHIHTSRAKVKGFEDSTFFQANANLVNTVKDEYVVVHSNVPITEKEFTSYVERVFCREMDPAFVVKQCAPYFQYTLNRQAHLENQYRNLNNPGKASKEFDPGVEDL